MQTKTMVIVLTWDDDSEFVNITKVLPGGATSMTSGLPPKRDEVAKMVGTDISRELAK